MSDSDSHTLSVNTQLKDLTVVTFPSTLKLTSTNYLGWKTQIEALLHGLDLHKFIDGKHPSPPPTKQPDGTSTPHQDYHQWFRQDKLLYGALVGSLSPPIVPLIINATSSSEAWNILATTYASPSRGHIKQLQHRLKQLTKTPTQTITDYMQTIKTVVDELASLGKPMDTEDVNDIILNGLDQSSYKPLLDAIHARDSSISFNELHEKLINHELLLAQQSLTTGLHQPASVFYLQHKGNNKPWQQSRQSSSNRPNAAPASSPNSNSSGLLPTPGPTAPSSFGGPRPLLGKCQWCSQRGHTLSSCPHFKKVNPGIVIPQFNRSLQGKSPQVNMMTASGTPSDTWLFDSGASHHVTNDLNNLSLHAPYDGTEDLVIGDGSGFTNHAPSGNVRSRDV